MVLAAAVAVLAAAATAWPYPCLLSREGLRNGEAWRLWTAHLTHGSALHLALNLAAGAVLVLLARPSAWLLLAAPLIGWGALALRPDLASYGGLSGLLHAHVGEALVQRFRAGDRSRNAWTALGMAALLAKVLADLGAGSGALTQGLELGVVPVPEAHLLGALAGVAVGLLVRWRRARAFASGQPGT